MRNRDLLECVCLAFSAMLVIVALGFPRGCSGNASEPAKAKSKRPAEELKEQRKSLNESCKNLMLVRLLVESELRKADKNNANRAAVTKKRSAGRGGNVGSNAGAKAPDLEVREPRVGEVRR